MKKLIKSITSYRKDYLLKNAQTNKIDTKEFKLSYTEYNRQNKIVKDIRYNQDGSIEQMYKYRYNDKGQMIEETLSYSENEIAEKRTFELDDKGLVKKEFRPYLDGNVDTLVYNYDSENNLIEKTIIDSDNNIDSKDVFEYNNKKITKESVYEEADNLISYNIYKYDEAGNIVETIKWEAEDNKKIKIVDFFIEKGSRTKSLVYNSLNQLISKTIFIEENDRIIQVLEEDQYKKDTTNITYDKKGNIIEEKEYNIKNQLNHKVIKKYNDNNDIIESAVFIDRHEQGINQDYVVRYEYEMLKE
jgi:antitoxin component YwqK of YwqJK toxin-antitoxin module